MNTPVLIDGGTLKVLGKEYITGWVDEPSSGRRDEFVLVDIEDGHIVAWIREGMTMSEIEDEVRRADEDGDADLYNGKRYNFFGMIYYAWEYETLEPKGTWYDIIRDADDKKITVVNTSMTRNQIKERIKVSIAIAKPPEITSKKRVGMSGASMIVTITEEAKRLGIERGDTIEVTIRK